MSKELTAKQHKFVVLVADGMSPNKAAALAGYSDPNHEGYRLRQLPGVQKALYERQMAALVSELLPKSLRRLDDILDDMSAAPSGIKLKAAQYVIDKTEALQNMANLKDLSDKSPLDMSEAELEIFVMRGRIVMKRETARRELGITDETS